VKNIEQKQRELTETLQLELKKWRKLIRKFNEIDKDELLYDICVNEHDGEDYLSDVESLVDKTRQISLELNPSLELYDSLVLSNLALRQINNHLRRILRKREILRQKGAENVTEIFNSICQK